MLTENKTNSELSSELLFLKLLIKQLMPDLHRCLFPLELWENKLEALLLLRHTKKAF